MRPTVRLNSLNGWPWLNYAPWPAKQPCWLRSWKPAMLSVFSGRPIDYANLLHLRKRQDAELVDSGMVNLKLSEGGLVDIEYFLQAQLIEHGADDPDLRVPKRHAGAQAPRNCRLDNPATRQ